MTTLGMIVAPRRLAAASTLLPPRCRSTLPRAAAAWGVSGALAHSISFFIFFGNTQHTQITDTVITCLTRDRVVTLTVSTHTHRVQSAEKEATRATHTPHKPEPHKTSTRHTQAGFVRDYFPHSAFYDYVFVRDYPPQARHRPATRDARTCTRRVQTHSHQPVVKCEAARTGPSGLSL